MDSVIAFDTWLFRLINGYTGTLPPLDRFMAAMVNEYFIPVTLSLIVFALWFVGGSAAGRLPNQKATIYAVLGVMTTNGLVALSNAFYFRPRPFATLPVNMLFYEPTDSSMPSNPTAVGFAFATAVWMTNRRAGALLYVLAALFAISRVYAGVHFPLDILGGAVVGATGAVVAVALGRGPLNRPIEGLASLARRLYLA